MPEELIVRHCSPTLAGLKTGSLFRCPYTEEKTLTKEIRALNRRLVPKGLRILPLRLDRKAKTALIYLYRPTDLKRDLSDDETGRLLCERGYTPAKAEGCIRDLVERLQKSKDFPHEIGLFLGYPPEDVRGFIENRACGHKCVGCWKVYGDVDKAQKTFERYEKCTRIFCRAYEKGSSLEGLAKSS